MPEPVRPLVTVAIPTFSRVHYLKKAVGSALSQTYENIEVIIGDDGQSPLIKDWGEEIASREPKIRYQRNERNLGLAGNWNALADAARGEFIVIIGDDDRLLPDFVGRLVDAILPDKNVAFSNLHLIDSRDNRMRAETDRHTRFYRRDVLRAGELVNAEAVVWQNSVPISAAMTKTSDVRRLRFKEDLNTPEIELFIRLAQERGRFVFVSDHLCEYRVHPDSETSVGLRGERLAEYLLEIPVAPDVEPYKREFMASLLINSVSRCLRHGEWNRARRLLNSEYYPGFKFGKTRRKSAVTQRRSAGSNTEPKDAPRPPGYFLRRTAQELCASLPESIGRPAYLMLQGFNFRLKKLVLTSSNEALKTDRADG